MDEAGRGARGPRAALGAVELTEFVCDASRPTLLDERGAQSRGRAGGDIELVGCSPVWTTRPARHPRLRPIAERVRLTTRLDLMHDLDGQRVDYLRRGGHCLVRRSWDRAQPLLSCGETATAP